MKNFFWC
ncbi:hypothetical protein BpHYR1_048903 [Brachionus plicatilis]|nr:hypothetical protein BpHYR1_048903 [Brachionus plicatilis]